MLWQKEANSNGMYIELLKNASYSLQKYVLNKEKNNVSSLSRRMDGNRLYAENDFKGALAKYNTSICLAEDSEHISLAYANRAQCFLKLNMHNFCLVDINLAKSNGYRPKLITKLESRECECLKKIDEKSIVTQPVMSFQDDKFLQMNDAFQIKRDDLYGRLVIANQDIKIGDTILNEEMYIRTVTNDEGNMCTTCGKKNMNFIPCKNCSSAMYCSENCADNSFHESECNMIIGTMEDIDELILTIRSVVIAIKTFSTIKELIKFTENCSRKSNESSGSPESKYGTFFELSTGIVSLQRIFDCREKAYFIFHAIMGSSKLGYKFDTIVTQRFLMHLVIHHYFVLCTNSFGHKVNGANVRSISLLASYINHSCLPNIAKLSKENISVCKAILPIKKGEQFFVTYLAENVFGLTAKNRNDQLEDLYGFRCKCQLCRNGPLRANALEDDPLFIYVQTNAMRVEKKYDSDLIRNVIQHCIKFLLQHFKMVGSEEVYYIADTLSALYWKELNGF